MMKKELIILTGSICGLIVSKIILSKFEEKRLQDEMQSNLENIKINIRQRNKIENL